MNDLLRDIPLAVGTVRCGSAHHQLVWEHGELNTPAHADPDAELALVALGAEPCRCLELLGYWRACAGDPRALILGPRERTLLRADPPAQAAAARTRRPGRLISGYSVRPPSVSTVSSSSGSSVYVSSRLVGGPSSPGARRQDPPPEDPLMAVLQVSHSLSRRLVATVAATLIEHDDPAQAAVLRAALHGRVLAGLTRWLGSKPELRLHVVDHPAPRTLSRNSQNDYTAKLPLQWLTEVWAPELTHAHEDHFTLSARLTPTGQTELRTVDHGLAVHTRSRW